MTNNNNNNINSQAAAMVAQEYSHLAQGYAWGGAAIAGNVVSGAMGLAASVLQFGADVIGSGAEYAETQSKNHFDAAALYEMIRTGQLDPATIAAAAQSKNS